MAWDWSRIQMFVKKTMKKGVTCGYVTPATGPPCQNIRQEMRKDTLKYWVRISINLILQLFLKASQGIMAQCKEFVFIFSTDRLIVFPLVLGE